MSLKAKLNRMKKHINTDEKKEEVKAVEPTLTVPHLEKWTSLDSEPFFFDDEYAIVRKKTYPKDHQHGRYVFNELERVIQRWNNFHRAHPLSSKNLNPSDLLFFDTETTGLGGGVGNTIFLLGYCQYTNEGISMNQYFLPGPGREVPMYKAFLDDVQHLKNLVTYNGKAFDWPQVKTRHTLIREQVPKLPQFGHFDLLHGARRFWKNEMESVRLSNVEQQKLDFIRKEDTPGYLAPMLYFEFVKDPDPDLISSVMKHNEEDILSLITLYIHMSNLLLDNRGHHLSAMEQFQSARWWEAVGEDDHAASLYQLSIDGKYDRDAKKALAKIHKKQGDLAKSLPIWIELSEDTNDEESDIELAKYYEHKEKDYEQALHHALLGYQKWKSKKRILKDKAEAERIQYMKRIERLEQKEARRR
ncbi:ribonuclease H-like domain-containing protein [Alkalihalobacillus sp. CinArs1]|uniref:ribonuclease H-like domain-containing protein n=1 Tax=Alkalihalobacillus sp. CinArs1 TaxID=2995314 RepID=UPI0022DD2586|nr:ribonuclease H-like domain-containing protein [Alkalihalobacillus sp. CinArs1]